MIFGRDTRTLRALSGLLILGQFLFGGGVAYAQTTTDDVSPVAPQSIEEEVPTQDPIIIPDTATEEASDLQGASSTPQLQETFTEQDAVDPTATTENDEVTLASTTEDVLPPEDVGDESATSTEEIATTTEPALGTPPAEDIVPPEEVLPPQEEVVSEADEVAPQEVLQTEEPRVVVEQVAPIVIRREELRPNPKYSFSVNTGKRITSNRKIRRETQLRSGAVAVQEVKEELSTPPAITVDNVNGTMNVSGSCVEKYYVILVYKNATDYDSDKRSFVVNRAFPCEGGAYSYNVVDLPPTLPDGTYYLLVAGMGEGTPWEPITSLTEIQLHRN
jgi:hypothetical protein